MSRILAIDYGEKRLGLAQTDPMQMIASPLDTVFSSDFENWLSRYTQTESVAYFVVGMPRQLSGEDTHSTQRVREFIQWLETKYPLIPVRTIDERYSSKEAQYHILNMGKKKNQRKEKGLIDAVAATLILQTFLQQQNS